MPTVFWTGRLSPSMKLLANLNALIAWMTGQARDAGGMKRRMQRGYEGRCSEHVGRYDELAGAHYAKVAAALLEGLDLAGREVLDVGCGTGIVSARVLASGSARVTCGDASEYMLAQCARRLESLAPGRFEARVLDAESLPFHDGSFDTVVSAMMLGLVPEQQRATGEMARVLRHGGELALATHGPECWWEPADAVFRAIPKRYGIGYRPEFWPRSDGELRAMLERAGLTDVRTQRLRWEDTFGSGAEAHDMFAAASASWWLTWVPPQAVESVARKTRNYFQSRDVRRITQDIILARGSKP